MAPYEFLRNIPLFETLSDSDLESLCVMVDTVHLAAGQVLFEEGSMGDEAYVIQEGELEVITTRLNREVLLAVRKTGDVIGEIALVTDTPRTATVKARTDTTLVSISRDQLRRLMHISPSAASALFEIVLSRWQSTQVLLRQSEKMAQLGTLTAGIAHELNNPAAAVRRGSEQLETTMMEAARTFMKLVTEELTPEQQETLQDMVRVVQAQARQAPEMDALARIDREQAMETWLEEQGVEDAWELAPTLASLKFSDEELERLTTVYEQRQLGTIIRWLNGNYVIFNLLSELQQGAARISEIVKALKSYTYLDQAPLVSVDIHRGLDDTLLILRHKLKKDINVRREYDPNLPNVDAHGSELNQVWTNLIDNAADAILQSGDGTGEIVLRTRQNGKWAIVEVQDDGPGIPADALPRIFEPFFTTKPQGKGTGLGLEISYNIVVHRHRGDIRVTSEPGKTVFQVWLPIHPDS